MMITIFRPAESSGIAATDVGTGKLATTDPDDTGEDWFVHGTDDKIV